MYRYRDRAKLFLTGNPVWAFTPPESRGGIETRRVSWIKSRRRRVNFPSGNRVQAKILPRWSDNPDQTAKLTRICFVQQALPKNRAVPGRSNFLKWIEYINYSGRLYGTDSSLITELFRTMIHFSPTSTRRVSRAPGSMNTKPMVYTS